jgi:hypothetical protein
LRTSATSAHRPRWFTEPVFRERTSNLEAATNVKKPFQLTLERLFCL